MSDSAYTILIAEDDDSIRHALTDVLTASGYEVLALEEGLAAIHAVRERNFDLALLDVAMPGADGFQVLQVMSEERPGTPVIMLTARGEEEDRVQGLKLGADDYIVKPFSIRELLARIEAVLRRSPERPRQLREIRIPGATLDSANRLITFKDGRKPPDRAGIRIPHLYGHPPQPRYHEGRTAPARMGRGPAPDGYALRGNDRHASPGQARGRLRLPLETLRSQGYRWNSSFVS